MWPQMVADSSLMRGHQSGALNPKVPLLGCEHGVKPESRLGLGPHIAPEPECGMRKGATNVVLALVLPVRRNKLGCISVDCPSKYSSKGEEKLTHERWAKQKPWRANPATNRRPQRKT